MARYRENCNRIPHPESINKSWNCLCSCFRFLDFSLDDLAGVSKGILRLWSAGDIS
jgi:hypothetical protein